MKKLLALLMVLSILLLSSCNGMQNVLKSGLDKTILDTVSYFEKKEGNRFTNWKSALAIVSSGGVFGAEEIKHVIQLDDGTKTWDVVGEIFLIEAAQLDSRSFNGKNFVQTLTARQLSDGTFGAFMDSVFAALVLENIGASYDREGIIKELIAKQNPDGGFSVQTATESCPEATGLVLSLLSCFSEDSRAKIMMDRAKEFCTKFLEKYDFANGDSKDISRLILGLVDAKEDVKTEKWKNLDAELLKYQSDDKGFKILKKDAEADEEATTLALLALDAIKRGGSVWSTIIFREGAVSIEILVDAKIQYSTGRFGIYAGETVLDVTRRFCVDNGLEIIHQMGDPIKLGIYEKNWKFKINNENVTTSSGQTKIKAGDTLVWE